MSRYESQQVQGTELRQSKLRRYLEQELTPQPSLVQLQKTLSYTSQGDGRPQYMASTNMSPAMEVRSSSYKPKLGHRSNKSSYDFTYTSDPNLAQSAAHNDPKFTQLKIIQRLKNELAYLQRYPSNPDTE